MSKEIVVATTGASGSIIAERLIEVLLELGHAVHLVLSKAGKLVVADELGDRKGDCYLGEREHERLTRWGERNFYAPFASGTAPIAGMALVPASLSSVGMVANGISDNLVRRAAEVMLKERRPLVLVPREAPLSAVHLENLLKVTRAGATVIPPVLTFYQHPGDSVLEQVDFVVSRVLDHLQVENHLFKRWGE